MYNKNCIGSYYHFDIVQLTIFTDADIDLNIYEGHFDPLNPLRNLIVVNTDPCVNVQHEVKCIVYLRFDVKYILLVATLFRSKYSVA